MLTIHQNLKNRVAVITGGSGVLCSAMALELARQGVKIAIINRNAAKGEKVVQAIIDIGGEALSIPTDVLKKEELIAARTQILSTFGQIDILINGAGGNISEANTESEYFSELGYNFFKLNEKALENVFSLNFNGTFLASQVFGEALLQSKAPTIINISSMSGMTPLTKIPAYSAAKAAINNFTNWLATHFAETGLRVNAIAPGFFQTEQNRSLLFNEDGSLSERSNKIIQSTPMKKFGEPNDLLGSLLFLADESYSSFVTGITIPVDGGFSSYSGV